MTPSTTSLRRLVGASVLAVSAVGPLLAPELWSGFRVALSDAVLALLAPSEQPLSVRSPVGTWAVVLALVWFSLAYRHRRAAPWEPVLVLVGVGVALVRLGNAWVDAVALVLPLARQISLANIRPVVRTLLTVLGFGVAGFSLAVSRPPALPSAASETATAVTRAVPGTILADWRWAGGLQRRVGDGRSVLAAGGLTSESSDFWLDYVRISQGHERWAEALRRMNVDVVVFDAADQQRSAADLVRASADWQVIYDADGALVAQRTGP